MDNLLNLLHLADSAFPVGAHAHSYGLETLVTEGAVTDAETLRALLRLQLLAVLARTDLVALRWAHDLAGTRDVTALRRLDAELSALKPVREWREGSSGAGRRLLATARGFLTASPEGEDDGRDGEAVVDALARDADNAVVGPHHALAYGVVGHALGIDADALAQAYAFGAVSAAVSAAVRLIPLGQTAAQAALHALKGVVAEAARVSATHPRDDMGGGLPLLDIAGMRHERAPARLFIS